jgi:hypothetical protein
MAKPIPETLFEMTDADGNRFGNLVMRISTTTTMRRLYLSGQTGAARLMAARGAAYWSRKVSTLSARLTRSGRTCRAAERHHDQGITPLSWIFSTFE